MSFLKVNSLRNYRFYFLHLYPNQMLCKRRGGSNWEIVFWPLHWNHGGPRNPHINIVSSRDSNLVSVIAGLISSIKVSIKNSNLLDPLKNQSFEPLVQKLDSPEMQEMLIVLFHLDIQTLLLSNCRFAFCKKVSVGNVTLLEKNYNRKYAFPGFGSEFLQSENSKICFY